MQSVDRRIEQQGVWWAFHRHLIIEMFEWLRERLGEAYLVDLESEVLLVPRFSGPARSVAPDVDVTVLDAPAGEPTTTLAPTPALVEADEALDEVEQYTIQVRRRDRPDPTDPFGTEIVSVVELVSPSNKGQFGTTDRRNFLRKRRDYLSSPVSYTEIDLPEQGERTLPRPVARLENHPYMVWASQVQPQTRHHWGWGWGAEDPLPSITLPLEYPHVHTLDLGHCYERAYTRNRWPLRLGEENET